MDLPSTDKEIKHTSLTQGLEDLSRSSDSPIRPKSSTQHLEQNSAQAVLCTLYIHQFIGDIVIYFVHDIFQGIFTYVFIFLCYSLS